MPAAPHLRVTAGALLAALPWLNPFAGGPSPAVQPWLVSMACALALWLLAVAGGAPARARFLVPAAALVLWAALAQLAVTPELAFLAAGLTLIALVASISDDPDLAQALQTGLLLAAVTSAVLGLWQYFGIASWFVPWVNSAPFGEAYANLRQPNQFSSLTWIGAAVLLWGTVRVRTPFALVLIVLLAVGNAASVSRTGMLQGVLLVALAAWWRGPERRRRLLLCAAAGAAYLAALLLLPVLLELAMGVSPTRTAWSRIAQGEPCTSRLVLWPNVLLLIAQKPLAGWGWGNLDYAHFMTLYPGSRFCDILDNAHNLPLHLAAELGVPAALLACAAALVWGWRQRPWSEAVPLRQLAWALVALILLHNMLEYPLWYGPFQLAFGAALGWLAPPAERGRQSRLRAPALAAAAGMLAATGYAAWDYERVSQIYLPPEERRAAWRNDTLEHALRSWLFSGQASFAELTLQGLTRGNAPAMYELSARMLRYSPEPRVIERMIESATMLGRDDEAVLHLARYRAAFPADHAAWRQRQGLRPLR